MGSQYQATNPHQTREIMAITSPQTTMVVASTQIQPMTALPPSLQCQETTVNTQYLTAMMNPHLQTTPSLFTIPQPSSTFNNPTMLHWQSRVMPMPDLLMLEFLKTSSSGLYTWPRDNSISTSFNPSDPFDFSAMNFSDLSSFKSGPCFGMDQYSSLLDMTAPVD